MATVHWSRTAIAVLTASFVGCTAGLAATSPPATPASDAASVPQVDVELVIAVDISCSMDPDELAIQRVGYS